MKNDDISDSARLGNTMASSLVKALQTGQRAGVLLKQASKAVSVVPQHADLHTSIPVQGVLTMPDRLQHIPEAAVRNQCVFWLIDFHLLLICRILDFLRW